MIMSQDFITPRKYMNPYFELTTQTFLTDTRLRIAEDDIAVYVLMISTANGRRHFNELEKEIYPFNFNSGLWNPLGDTHTSILNLCKGKSSDDMINYEQVIINYVDKGIRVFTDLDEAQTITDGLVNHIYEQNNGIHPYDRYNTLEVELIKGTIPTGTKLYEGYACCIEHIDDYKEKLSYHIKSISAERVMLGGRIRYNSCL